jgi:glutaredoxin
MTAETALTLLSRPGCHLCEETAAMLERIGAVFATINIEADADLERRYGEHIPVILFGDREVARAPITLQSLREALAKTGLVTGRG